MKLKNSIEALKKLVESNIKAIGIDKVRECYKTVNYKECKDTSFLWLVWFNIPQEKRQDIIALSIDRSEWVGGYPDYTDTQLQTLLKRAVNLDWIRCV